MKEQYERELAEQRYKPRMLQTASSYLYVQLYRHAEEEYASLMKREKERLLSEGRHLKVSHYLQR